MHRVIATLALAASLLVSQRGASADPDDGDGAAAPPAAQGAPSHPADPSAGAAVDDHGAPPGPTIPPADAAGAATSPAHDDDRGATPYVEFDADGDGQLEPDEAELQVAFQRAFAGAPAEVSDAELDRRPEGHQLVPSLTVEQLREMVKVARAKVLGRLEAKFAQSSGQRLARVGALIRWFSLAGVLLLAMPLVLRRRYPGQGRALVGYSALAAVTFVATVNLFGVVVQGYRGAQGALGAVTNPQLRIAEGFFDSLERNAADYLVMGKELFAPTLAQLRGDGEEQPAAILIENGVKIVQDAKVFVTIARTFKRLDTVFAALPIVLLLVTMALFIVAVWPTLLEIIRLPVTAASGKIGAGREVVARALRRVGGELVATLCTLGVLAVMTLLSGAILGRVIAPALDALIDYFQLGISYLQFVSGASSGQVFVMLFGVIVFLVLNLAVVIAAMSLYLGKAQKVFQRRWNDGVPLLTHRRFWLWGTASAIAAQALPLIYLVIAGWGLDEINGRLTAGVADAAQVPWKPIMLAGPLFLVVGFLVVFWAARGAKALAFLARYKIAR